MRVTFTVDPYASRGGGSLSFAQTLCECFRSWGIEVSFDLRRPTDVVLLFANTGAFHHLGWLRMLGARVVHRLDERIDPEESPARREKHRHLVLLNGYADLTIFQSDFVRGNVGPHLSRGEGEVIRNGVDTGRFHPEGARFHLEGSPSVLHSTWSVGGTKRLDRIQELLDLPYRDLVVHCIGRHAKAQGPWKRHPRVRILGEKDAAEVAAHMRSADFLFFPSVLDPCPNTVLEAMASGLPVLYDPTGGTPELVGDAGIPLEASLDDGVRRILAERDVLRERGFARVVEFEIQKVARRYLETMQRVVEGSPRVRITPLRVLRDLWSG